MKYILHVDMNSFFASVEELQDPSYKNKPIAVSGRTARSVVASANYIARAKGVKAAMPVFMAQRLCPGLIIALPHFNLYHEYSERFMRLISEKFTNNIEIGSIDECYVDITSLVTKKQDPVGTAMQIQKTILKDIGLKCSIGIANNKFLAKMASDYKKPLGITTMWQNEIEQKLWPQPIENMLWIGKASAELLKQHGIKTIRDIANDQNKPLLEKLLDKNWYVHHQHANGFGTDELDYSHNLPKSIGSSETFLRDTNDFVEIKEKLVELTNDVVRRLKYHEQKAKTISINIKTIDFKTRNKSFTLSDYTDDLDKIVVTATNLYQEYFANTTIRLVGISVSNLIENSELFINSELFDDYMKQPRLEIKQIDEKSIISGINQKFSKNILGIAKDKLK